MSLPPPREPIEVDPSDAEFFDPDGGEDAALLATGAFDDEPAETGLAPRKRGRVVLHVH